jgi:hypothetical protein
MSSLCPLEVVEADCGGDDVLIGNAYQVEGESDAVPGECVELVGVFFFEKGEIPGVAEDDDCLGGTSGSAPR